MSVFNRLLLLVLVISLQAFAGPSNPRHRLIVLTDIGAEVDDSESMVRLLLYANVIDIRGLVATTSIWQKNRVAPELIRHVIEAYGKVRHNLARHEPGFPGAATLLSRVKAGRPEYGMQGVGADKHSQGSDWIIHVLKENDVRPLWVCVWGGSNTLAHALYDLRRTTTAEESRKLIAKLRVYTISDQDDSGIWIRSTFPDLFYIVSPGGYGRSTWSAITEPGTGVSNEVISNWWLAKNIQQGHGPLGATYPDIAYGMEGDTPSWLSLIPNGLSDADHPNWGGWGGRYESYIPDTTTVDIHGVTGGVPIKPETRPIWTNAADRVFPVAASVYGRAVHTDSVSIVSNKMSLWRWREDFQNDFAARMAWCVKPVKEANHPPVPVVDHPDSFTVNAGDTVKISAFASTDPDGDNLSYLWLSYPEAGSCKTPVQIDGAEDMPWVTLVVPRVKREESVHVVLRVTDKGTPALSRYRRFILHVLPA